MELCLIRNVQGQFKLLIGVRAVPGEQKSLKVSANKKKQYKKGG